MSNYNILLTLGIGVFASFTLFFLFFKVLKWSGKLAALLTILLVQAVYIPLAATHWAGLDVFAIHFAFYTMAAAGLGIITSNQSNQSLNATTKRGLHWAPAIIIGFFIVLAMIDGTIISLVNKGASAEFMRKFLPEPKTEGISKEVTSTFSGGVAHDFQKNVANYNRYVTQLKEQAALGWRIEEGWLESPIEGKATLFRLHVIDDEGMPVTGAQVKVDFLFTADKNKDMQVTLAEQEPGFYGQSLTMPDAGVWMLVINVVRGKDIFEAKGETKVDAKQ